MDFKTTKDREKFEKKFKSRAKALTDYHKKDDGSTDFEANYVVYNMKYLGYAEPEEILEECLKEGIKITFMAWLPISDSGVEWKKIRGRWEKRNLAKCFLRDLKNSIPKHYKEDSCIMSYKEIEERMGEWFDVRS